MKKQSKVKVNRKPKKTGAIITSVILALFVVLAVVAAIVFMYKPDYSDIPSFLPEESGNAIVVTDPEGNDVEIVRDNEKINVLILGKDRWAFNTDVMIIASFNVTDGQISMMQIPRDTYIDVGRGNKKANSLLASFYNEALRQKAADPMAYAIKGMEETFEKVFCITIDYYALMDLNGFVNIVDAMGGVEVDVPFNMKYSDPIQGLNINLKKGLQTLNGDQAEQFIRFRADYVEGDIGRVDAQKIFISACISKLKSSFNVTTISNIVKEVVEYVETDFPVLDIVHYAKSALSVDLNNMVMLTLPGVQGRQYDKSGTWFYFTFRDGTISAVNKYFNSYNFEVTAEIFDRDGALYDEDGSYMHSVFLTPHKEEDSYTVDSADDIYIYKYNYSSKPATKATTAKVDVTMDVTLESGEKLEPLETEETLESGLHTETSDHLVTEEITVETDYTDEPLSTDAPEYTEGVTVAEESMDPIITEDVAEEEIIIQTAAVTENTEGEE